MTAVPSHRNPGPWAEPDQRAPSERIGPPRAEARTVLQMGGMPPFAGLAGRQLGACRHRGIRHAVILVEIELPARPGNRVEAATLDDVLKAAGARLRARVRDTDTVARLDGQRFGVLLTDAGKADLAAIQARLYRAVHGNYGIGDRLLQVQARLGAAISPHSGGTGVELVCAAEAALGWTSPSMPWADPNSRLQLQPG
ncbi:MAG: diguanylate cyclase [Burkholderiaceae bacterium]